MMKERSPLILSLLAICFLNLLLLIYYAVELTTEHHRSHSGSNGASNSGVDCPIATQTTAHNTVIVSQQFSSTRSSHSPVSSGSNSHLNRDRHHHGHSSQPHRCSWQQRNDGSTAEETKKKRKQRNDGSTAEKETKKKKGVGSSPAYWAETDLHAECILAGIFAENGGEGGNGNNKNSTTVWERWPLESQLGFDVTYDRRRVLEEEPRLEVIVMPHSHNDPGFKRTLERDYERKTRRVLSSAHSYLGKVSDVSFAWVEAIFLDKWWQGHGAEEREAFRRVVNSGQVEILTGGWVMPDEAATHYYGLVMQLLEGHEWLRNHLGVNATPVTHWNIDSNGLSSTMPYLLGEAGIRQGVVKRVHFAIKSHLAARRQLEFRWRQAWAGASASTDFLTHVMPLYGTHISFTCGVDPKVCCQFDFQHLKADCLGGWGGSVIEVTESNLVERSDLLADQFRKKAQLFKSHVVLVPWGEDHRYVSESEWSDQVDNLRRIFDHINAHPKRYNMHVRFGTTRQYFDLLRQQLATTLTKHKADEDGEVVVVGDGGDGSYDAEQLLPTLSGDFLPYSGMVNYHWTGYYINRPFYKQLDRWLQHYLRAADILYTAAINHRRPSMINNDDDGGFDAEVVAVVERMSKGLVDLYPHLVVARRTHALFQHHDAIGGTSNTLVMKDYGMRMLDAIHRCTAIISKATSTLLMVSKTKGEEGRSQRNNNHSFVPSQSSPLFFEHEFPGLRQQPQQRVIPPPSELILFNPLGVERADVVCVMVPTPSEEVDMGTGFPLVYEFIEDDSGGELGGKNIEQAGLRAQWNDSEGARGGVGKGKGAAGEWKPIPQQQIEPVVLLDDSISRMKMKGLSIAEDKVKLCFLARLPALSFRSFHLDYGKSVDGGHGAIMSPPIAKLRLKGNGEENPIGGIPNKLFPLLDEKERDGETMLTVANEHISLSFNPKTGFLQQMERPPPKGEGGKIESASSQILRTELSFIRYTPKPYDGLPHPMFTFHPEGPAQPLQNSTEAEEGNAYVLIEGPVRKSVMVRLGGPYCLLHAVELDAHSDAPTIRNRVDLSHLRGGIDEEVEVGMRLQTDPRLTDFYTEVNAYQFVRRRRFEKAPLGAQRHPMSGAALVENRQERLSLLGGQALGVASMQPGWMEVMLDRQFKQPRISRDLDGIHDNSPTESVFRLVWENYPPAGGAHDEEGGNRLSSSAPNHSSSLNEAAAAAAAADIAYHSLGAHQASLQLQYPVLVQYAKKNLPEQQQQSSQPSESRKGTMMREPVVLMVGEALPPDVHLVALRTLSNATDYDSSSSSSSYEDSEEGENTVNTKVTTTTADADEDQNTMIEDVLDETNTLVNHASFTSLTTRPRSAAALILHRVGVECRLSASLAGASQELSRSRQCNSAPGGGGENDEDADGMDFELRFGDDSGVTTPTAVMKRPRRVAEASLTLLRVAKEGEKGGNLGKLLHLNPMEIKSWQLEF